MIIRVFDLSGEYAITTEDGQKLFTEVESKIRSGILSELDFTGVRVFASPFFNAAVGRLLKDRSMDDLGRLIKLRNLSKVGELVLSRVVENSEQYYRNPAARKALDSILERDADVDKDGPGDRS